MIKNLADLFQNTDEEKEDIVRASSNAAYERIKVLSEGNELAKEYLTDMWTDIFSALRKKGLNPQVKVFPEMLRIMADTLEMRQKLFAELEEKRRNQNKENKEH